MKPEVTGTCKIVYILIEHFFLGYIPTDNLPSKIVSKSRKTIT